MSRTWRWALIGLVSVLLLMVSLMVAASRHLTYAGAIAAGRALPVVQQLEQLFPSSVHSISYFTEELGARQWNSVVSINDRYILEMTMFPYHVTKQDGRVRVIDHGSPRFELYDVQAINVRAGGSIQAGRAVVRWFGMSEWQRLVETNGDWSSIGVELRDDDPIDGFDLFWDRING